MYIYQIINAVNGKRYIGRTISQNPKTRWYRHVSMLRSNRHANKHLQAAWNKHGEHSFSFDILQVLCDENVDQAEMDWIKKCQSNDPMHGYNMTAGGEGQRSCPMPKKTMEALRKANTGKKLSETQKAALRKANFERVFSLETRKKMSESA